MAKSVKPLSDSEIKTAKEKDKVYNLSDGNGLALRVKPNGTKSWIFTFQRPITKKRAAMSFGTYPDLTLKAARAKTSEARTLLSEGIDPSKERKESDNQKLNESKNTLLAVATEWIKVKRSKVTNDHANDIWRSLELHIFPDLGNISISQITAPMAIKAIKPLEAQGSLEHVKRVCQRLNEIMTFALNSGLIDANACYGIRNTFQAPIKKNMPTIPPSELPKLIKKVSQSTCTLQVKSLIQWQLHTMVRPSEAAGARWSEIDFEKRIWSIPADRMKKKKPHIVPLTDEMLALLNTMKEISGNRVHIFTGHKDKTTHAHPETANRALKRMGYDKRLVAHGLRSLASTTLNEQGFDPDIIEAALAHNDPNQVRAAYNRTDYLERRRRMMDWWSAHIQGRENTDNVSQLKVI